jgi:phospholipase/lecithinase/hemolysin
MRKALTILATFLALPAAASTFGPYDDIYVFGDSLSDSGNIALAAPAGVPNPPYPLGQFTNGNTWTTQLGLTPSIAGGTNYAWGGARAAENGDFIPDLLTQIGSFTSTVANIGSNPLAVIWVGGNDFRDLQPGDDLGSFVKSITNTITRGVRDLTRKGIEDVVIFNLPNFSALPQYAGDPLGAGQAGFISNVVNDAIATKVSRLDMRFGDADIGLFDLDSVFQDVLASVPASLRQTRCLDDIVDCTVNPTDYVFFDDIHPTEWVHTQLANAFSEQVLQEQVIAPVPLPAGGALLLTGFAGFALWGKRRKSLA